MTSMSGEFGNVSRGNERRKEGKSTLLNLSDNCRRIFLLEFFRDDEESPPSSAHFVVVSFVDGASVLPACRNDANEKFSRVVMNVSSH